MPPKIISIHTKPQNDQTAILTVENLHVHMAQRCILHGIDLRIEPGAMTAIMGRNGTGKTSLLKTIMGLLPKSAGRVTVARTERRFRIGYMPQISEFDREFPMTVYNLVKMGALRQPFQLWVGREKRAQVLNALEQVGLSDYRHYYIQDLSVGQLKRALFARLIVQDAGLMLLDEPFAGMDEESVENLMQLLLRWKKQGKTTMVVLHDTQLAQRYFDHTLLLDQNGHVYGPTAKILNNSAALAKAVNPVFQS